MQSEPGNLDQRQFFHFAKQPPAAFQSFWMGGFEGADHVNGLGHQLDMARASGHVQHLADDHRRAAEMGIRTVRESIGWRLSEPSPGVYDFARARRTALSARAHGLQVVWTFMHYGTPPGLRLLDEQFCSRFVAFATAVAREVGPLSIGAPVYNLINEISFLSWAVSATDMVHPYRADPRHGAERDGIDGDAVKHQLVRATLQAAAAILHSDASARFLQVEPLVHVAAPHGRPDLDGEAARVVEAQWQTWDLLANCDAVPALQDLRPALDIVGVNHYHNGQWELGSGAWLDWHTRDARRLAFSELLQRTWLRYGRPIVVSETSHVGEGRSPWLDEMASNVAQARAAGAVVDGICLYPLVDRPDWSNSDHWHRSGLWDVEHTAVAGHTVDSPNAPDGSANALRRVLCADYAATLKRWQRVLPSLPSDPSSTTRKNNMQDMQTLVVFSHLRWGFVWQRPQHLLSRLASHASTPWRVIFVEEPLHTDGPARLECIARGPHLQVLVPHTPIAAPGFHDDQMPALRALLKPWLLQAGVDAPVLWFYTPMALPLLDVVAPAAVVFDCMDELSAFDHAPRQLLEREAALLERADLVITGGPALYAAKRARNANVHCLPSSVDAAHYAPDQLDSASGHGVEAQRLQGSLPRPRLGYFGVIDERFDVPLLKLLAERHPEWQLVMVGPVVKIDPDTLPRMANVHWLGMQPYDRLPHLMAQWDVCLMPFALNASTRFISPTKTLEYMAGGKPVVSTPVSDVIGLYGEEVRIASSSADFVEACEEALAETPDETASRQRSMARMVERSSWDHSTDLVQGWLAQALRDKASADASPVALAAA